MQTRLVINEYNYMNKELRVSVTDTKVDPLFTNYMYCQQQINSKINVFGLNCGNILHYICN